ncbi:histidinol-phosphate transaminase [Corynebacterium sp. CMW7794]|uniref:Aromatic amino acid aminotransferase n=1 Tax=Corynebacterium phoceense TaxID=1686286 RepID=A0A540R640_9CORY|nr:MULTISPECIES: histidinol-phosphate transaminase [Corynebacterium]KXB56251.1 histidinol-phosphate transaminase [Corynebacterium sp. DNF00584]KXI15239.1 histidinol-phosphate transaminase [Corynebacterium sp. CMW7794]MBF9012211.1 histidinol-phosphate transaminase [Corynebacterium phoceense]OFL77566.1 aminotransferase [Corynebacterium sp. HMSC077B05]OFN40255.1 aminotransferase [Corynebacterium sp. HMSC072G08]
MIRPDLSSLPAYVPGKRQEDALKLSSNEATQPPLPAAVDAMAAAAAGANRYPDMGAVAIREALAEHLGVAFEQVAVGTGSSALCQQLVQVTCTDGDEVVFPWRSFEAYPIFAQVHGATPVAIPLKDEGVDLEAMAAAITDRTRLIFICNPNNPSGSIVTRAEFAEFMAKVPAEITVALDEAYTEYLRAEDTPLATEEIAKYPNLVGLRTFSKAYGLAGLRIGYAFGQPEMIEALNKVAIPFSVNSVAQAGALASLAAQDELKQRTDTAVVERQRVIEATGAYPSEANFVWLPGETPELAAALAEQGVLVRSFPEGIRITVTTPEETDQLLAAWKAVRG